MKKRDFPKTDVEWFIPVQKRPFYYTSKYAKNSLCYMANKFVKKHKDIPTVKQMRELYKGESEQTKLLDELIKRGFGDDMFFYNFQ